MKLAVDFSESQTNFIYLTCGIESWSSHPLQAQDSTSPAPTLCFPPLTACIIAETIFHTMPITGIATVEWFSDSTGFAVLWSRAQFGCGLCWEPWGAVPCPPQECPLSDWNCGAHTLWHLGRALLVLLGLEKSQGLPALTQSVWTNANLHKQGTLRC